MKGAFKQNVSPRIVAVAVLITLAAIQWWWWQALVAKRSGRSGPGSAQQSSRSGPTTLYIAGREDADVETIAGALEPGFVDGAGHAARFDGPTGILIDRDGSLLVADTRNHRIRRVFPSGATVTFAGESPGFRDGPISQALFNAPSGLRRSADGSIMLLDAGNSRIRRISGDSVTTSAVFPTPLAAARMFNEASHAATAAVNRPQGDSGSENMTLTALEISSSLGSALASADNRHSAVFYVVNGSAYVIAGLYSPNLRMEGWLDGKGDKSRFGRIGGIAAANDRTIYVADTSNNCIRRITVPEGG